MDPEKRVRSYAKEHFNEVYHCTLNPEGPGAVRIHLVPPKLGADGDEVGASVAIINGQDVIPVNTSWSILLIEFIREVNRYSGKAVSDADVQAIQDATCKAVRKVYPFMKKKRLKADIYTIMKTFDQVAHGEIPEEPIDYVLLGDYAPFMRAPHRMDLMVSAMTSGGRWNCNQQCVHCYAAGQARSSEAELGTEEWKRIIDACRAAGVTQITFTGGEPTMRDDLFELIEYGKWFVTRVNTNGIKLTPEYCERLRAASLDSVQVTFYSCDEAIHDKLVGAHRFADTVAGIENALAAGISLSVNTPLCTLNRDYVRTLEFLHEKGVIYVTCSGLITTGNAARPASERLQLAEDELQQVLADAVAFCHAHGMEISFTSPGWVDAGFCHGLGITAPACGACLSNMAVTPGGHVVPCQSWLDDEPLGDMLADDWRSIWEGARCKEIRDNSAMMDGNCPLRIRREEVAPPPPEDAPPPAEDAPVEALVPAESAADDMHMPSAGSSDDAPSLAEGAPADVRATAEGAPVDVSDKSGIEEGGAL